jgi:4-amino-4-deoxy-L-arabinose transferase-like glycosyltransferase
MGFDEGDRETSIRNRAWARLLVLALSTRLAWALVVPVEPTSDSFQYDRFSRILAVHGVYGNGPAEPTAFWPVGTSFLYSVLYRAFGPNYAAIVALNVILGVAIVVLTVLLARRWFGARVALAAGGLVACWPALIEFTTVLASELPFIVAVMLAVLVWQESRLRWWGAACTGMLLAAAAYLRPTALLLLPFLAVASLVDGVPWRRILALAGVAGIAMLACIAPWSARNTRVFGRPVLVSTNGGTNTWMGNNPRADGFYMDPPALAGMNEAERDEYLGAQARDHVLRHPIAFAGRSLVKLVRLHERESIGVSWNEPSLRRHYGERVLVPLKIVSNVFWWAVLALALSGLVLRAVARGWRFLGEPPALLWGYFAAVHAVTVIQDRYHFSSIPWIAMYASLALTSFGSSRRSPAAPPDPARSPGRR